MPEKEFPRRDPQNYTEGDIRVGVDGLYVAIHEAGAPRNGEEVVIGHYSKKERGRNLTGNSFHDVTVLKIIFSEDMIKLKCKINTRYFIFKT